MKYMLKILFVNQETEEAEITEVSCHRYNFTRWLKKHFTVGYNKTISCGNSIEKYSLEPEFVLWEKD